MRRIETQSSTERKQIFLWISAACGVFVRLHQVIGRK
jgi:hypothetical protein